MKIAGPYAMILVCITVSLACLTTAVALISSFADFLRTQIFNEKISYKATLIGSLAVTFFVSTFEFTGISAFLTPILEICYPGIILFTFLNLASFKNISPVKTPVFAAFTTSLVNYFA